MCVLAQLEQLRHVIMYRVLAVLYRIDCLQQAIYFSCQPVPVFAKDGTKGHEKK
jgi:hypothetical protein